MVGKEKGLKSKRKRGGGSKGGGRDKATKAKPKRLRPASKGKRKSSRNIPLVSYVAKEEDY